MADGQRLERHSALRAALKELSQGLGVQREDLLEALAGELSELRRCWGIKLDYSTEEDREQAIRAARQIIRINLNRHIAALHPGKRVVPNAYRYAVNLGFNMQTQPEQVHLRNKDITRRRDWLANEAPIRFRMSASTSYRYLDHAITQIEQQILDAGYKPVLIASTPGKGTTQQPARYVARPRLYTGAKTILDQKRRVALIGEPGTGKTVLAHMLGEDSTTSARFVIRSGKHFMDDVITVLDAYRLPFGGSEAALRHQLTQLMTQRSDLLITFDNVADWDDLDQFVNEATQCQVIATSNRWPSGPWSNEYGARVRDMSPDEGLQMAVRYAPRLSAEQAKRLTEAVRYRPIVIAHTCGFLQENEAYDVDTFISSLEARTTLILDSVAEATEQNLRITYQETVKELREKHPLAASLLAFLAFMEKVSMDHMEGTEGLAYIMLRLGLFANKLTNESIDSGIMACVKAERLLVDRFLIERGIILTHMHPLTARILRDILSDEEERIQADVGKILNAAMMGVTLEYAKDYLTKHPEVLDPQHPRPERKSTPEDASEDDTYERLIKPQVDDIAAGNLPPEDMRLIQFMTWASKAVTDKMMEMLQLSTHTSNA